MMENQPARHQHSSKMNDVPYSKREIDNLHKSLHDKLDEIFHEVKRTNGRLSKLEVWRSFISGGLAILMALVVPTIIWIIKIHLT